MPQAAQELLAIAAVIGRIINSELLLAVASANWSQREIVTGLEAACRAKLLVEMEPEDSAEVTYRFAHDLIREVVEADLSGLRYRLLHGEIAGVLEHKLAGSSPEILAYHYRRAGDWKKALRHLLGAVEHARQIAAQREEAALLSEAIECAIRTGQSQLALELRVQRGKVCRSLALWAEADSELTKALAGLEEIPLEAQAEVLLTLAEVRHWQLDTPATRLYATKAAQIAEQSGHPDLVARALSVLAISDSSEGKIQSSLTNFEAAFSKAGAERLSELVSGVELYGLIYYWLSRFDQATTISRQALELGRQSYDNTTIARSLANLGLALSGKGQYTEAFRVFEEAREFTRKHSMGQWLARATSMYGGVHLELFNYGRAEELAREARQISQKLNWPLAETSAGIDLLFNFIRSGRVARAEALTGEVSKAVEAGQGAHGWLWRLRFAAVEAELWLAQGEVEKALDRAEYLIGQSRLSERVKYEILGLLVQGKGLAASGVIARAKTVLARAVGLARNTGNPALFSRASAAYLALFEDQPLLEEARSLVKVVVANLKDEEVSRYFLASSEIQTINGQT